MSTQPCKKARRSTEASALFDEQSSTVRHTLKVGQRVVHSDLSCSVTVTELHPASVSIAYEGEWDGYREKIPLEELEEKLHWRTNRQDQSKGGTLGCIQPSWNSCWIADFSGF
mmetsp:Transcript_7988/g.16095  ORF Transcript_7988/g.16095 Transcript_7988/m.16095 type:complete len:113 (-) Transcript_7988:217-555(-)